MSLSVENCDWYFCPKCKKSFITKSNDKDKHLLRTPMRCPNFRDCAGRITLRDWTKAKGKIDDFQILKAVELYQASAGVGLPGERNCSPQELKKLMVGSKITAVELDKTSDPNKSLFLSVTLESGKVIHLATSTQGPIIYKITETNGG